ncbi:hypothetical protein [Paenibacillus cremeus]|uniref:Uncharacterized protein n=1 Tax=Paenibacillus cremeus TaxID=2163881 RepID=A0A559KB50_9BACL|nr:hypothetical protein [Paenibacillus cremeus]TVY09323.1 hypothetical protein FPZ49_14140 [Paenibacillus cremeus]
MKRKQLITGLAVALIATVAWSINTQADAPATTQIPGSVDDPIITKSYFDQNIQKKIADELAKQLGSGTSTTSTAPPATAQGTGSPQATGLTVIKLEQGQTLYGGAGTEFIVRTGKATAFSSDDSGMADVTTGKDVIAGQAVELNHLLIVPREGRGIKPVPKSNLDTYVMIRGSYLLTNADGTKVTP